MENENLKKKSKKRLETLSDLIKKHPDKADYFNLYYGEKNILFTEKGPIDFDSASINNLSLIHICAGRAGKSGKVISIATFGEKRYVNKCAKELGIRVEYVQMREGKMIPAEPVKKQFTSYKTKKSQSESDKKDIKNKKNYKNK